MLVMGMEDRTYNNRLHFLEILFSQKLVVWILQKGYIKKYRFMETMWKNLLIITYLISFVSTGILQSGNSKAKGKTVGMPYQVCTSFFSDSLHWKNKKKVTRDGILGHHFDKRLESFAPCYSHSFYWWIFKENQTLLWVQKYIKKSPKQEDLSLFWTAFWRK